MLSKERMKIFETHLKGIYKSSIMHHEVVVTKGLSQKIQEWLHMWQINMDLWFSCEEGVCCCYLGTINSLLSCCIIMHKNMFDEKVLC